MRQTREGKRGIQTAMVISYYVAICLGMPKSVGRT